MKLAVDMILALRPLDKTEPWKYALVKRNYKPFKGHWALPGGIVEDKDTIKETVIKETKEETGLDISENQISIEGYADDIDRDPRERIVSIIAYIGLGSIKQPELKGDHEVQEAGWFTMEEIKEMKLAFDHSKIITEYT